MDLRNEVGLLHSAELEKDRLSKEGDVLKEQARLKYEEGRRVVDSARSQFIELVQATRLEYGGRYYRPSIEKLSHDLVLLGIGEDRLWGYWSDKEHFFGPAGEGSRRQCEDCGLQMVYDPVNLAPL